MANYLLKMPESPFPSEPEEASHIPDQPETYLMNFGS
jgi:hypothetical protein